MERDIPFDVDVDLPDDDLPLEGGADAPPPPPPDPPERGGGGRGGSLPLPDGESGPWFTLSMVVYVGFTALLTAAALGSAGGEGAAYAISFGLLVVYLSFFVIGAFWFRSHRYR